MPSQSEAQRTLAIVIGSAALGAAAMFMLDPDKGRRRRAIGRDKARSLLNGTRDAVGVATRDTTHRARGLRARARRFFTPGAVPDDLQLIERVRARMGRLLAHPHAIQVGANNGRVTLSGPILAHEVRRLLDAVGRVWGVSDVEDRLVVHETAESISSLQGGVEERKGRAALQRGNWPPSLRVVAVLGGFAMALGATRQRPLAAAALVGAGLALAIRGATNVSLRRLADMASGTRGADTQARADAGEDAREAGAPPDEPKPDPGTAADATTGPDEREQAIEPDDAARPDERTRPPLH